MKPLLRLASFFVLPGAVTILCHAAVLSPLHPPGHQTRPGSAVAGDVPRLSSPHGMPSGRGEMSAGGQAHGSPGKLAEWMRHMRNAGIPSKDTRVIEERVGVELQSASSANTPATDARVSDVSARRIKDAAPVIAGQDPNPLVTAEETALTIDWNNLQVKDPDSDYPHDFSMVIEGGTNYTVAGRTITPVRDFNGMLAVRVVVNDGEHSSAPFDVQVSVTPVNDAPVITGQDPDPLTTRQDHSLEIVPANVTVADPDNVYPADFSFTVLPGEQYTVSGSSITPAPGFVGMLAVNVAVRDGAATSASFPLRVSVAADSDPVITGQRALSTNEDTPLTIALSDLVVSDPDDSYPDGFTLRVLPGSNYSVEGTTLTPVQDYAGPLVVPVTVNDGSTDSEPFQLQVSVLNVNDAPVITGQVPLATDESQSLSLVLSDLAVSDPDNEYPGSFTLYVMGGENYSVSGTTITPAAGFNGALAVTVFVNDGTDNSNFFTASITVNPVNDAPVITGQALLQVNEDTPLTLSLQNLSVADPDNNFPDGFTLIVEQGENYSVSGTTVTPSPDFTGTLAVSVLVNDGVNNSASFPLQVSVLPVNDAPVIAGPATFSTPEDVAKTIALTDLVVSDPDNTFPSGFTLAVFQGTGYTVAGTTVTPDPDFFGTLKVQIQVNDGLLNSNVFTVDLAVMPVNDAPVITGQTPVQTPEDTPVTIGFHDLTVLDIDNNYPAGYSLIISSGSNYTFAGSTVTPARDFNGTLNVNITVHDGISASAPFAFQIQVGDANDAPVITGQTSLATNEEQPVAIALSNLTVTDPDNPYPTGFTLLVSAGVNYTVSGQTITPEVNFWGTLTVPVRVNDGINNSATFDLKIQVNPVNDPPFFAAIPNQQISENGTAGSVAVTGISKGPLEDAQLLTFVATSGNTAVIEDPVVQYSGTGSTATLSYVVKPNASGIVTITLVAIDNGSNVPPNQNSYSSSFQIDVTEINSAPTLDAINPITILEDAEQQNISLTGISAGPGESQVLTASVTSNRPEFFPLLEVTYTSPEGTGILRFKSAPDIFGTAQVSVTITDDGPGTPPHANTITRSFAVTIQAVNDPPSFTSSPITLAATEEPYEYEVGASDPDGDKVTISCGVKPVWASFRAGGNGVAILSGTPAASAFGANAVKLEVTDGSVTVEQSFDLIVNARPTVSSLSVVTAEDSAYHFAADFFNAGYSDINNNALASVLIVSVPVSGQLLVSGREVKVSDTIAASSFSALVYHPNENYSGMDSFGWQAFDGFHMSRVSARVNVSVLPIDDPPVVLFEKDTLQYEVNGESAFLSPLLTISDVDDDTLSQATVGFHAEHYRPEMDVLQFSNAGNIRGTFNYQNGQLTLSGHASVSEYTAALRSVAYLHQNTLDPILEPKAVSVVLDDGEMRSAPKDKIIVLQYTFIEFNIPSGFTPNGDHANDTWVIERPGGGLEELDDAVISVYDKKGVLVFRTEGFDRPWDGTMNGKLLPADSYFFTIDLRLRNKKTYKGIVTLLR